MNDHLGTDPVRSHYTNVTIWLEEAIWGHRIYDESTAMLLLLELLNVVASVRRQGKPLFQLKEGDRLIDVDYRHSLPLRLILFNNGTLDQDLTLNNDSERWARHCAQLDESWAYIGKRLNEQNRAQLPAEGFAYLKKRFDGRFEDYHRLVVLLQENALEIDSNKRWTSQFLFPYCEEALFEDLNDKSLSPDRRFFGRSGELAYLMLAKSGFGAEIAKGLDRVFFNPNMGHVSRWRNAVTSLLPPIEHPVGSPKSSGALPVMGETHLQCCHEMGKDVAALLASGLPEYDVTPYLAQLIMLHMSHYLLRVALADVGEPVVYTIEVKGSELGQVRRLARASFAQNRELTTQRIERELQRIYQDPEIQPLLGEKTAKSLLEWLMARYGFMNKDHRKLEAKTPDEVWKTFKDDALRKHKSHLANAQFVFSREAGLCSREGTTSYRYSLSDDLLRILVLANVSHRLEYKTFLDLLFHRYGFVINQDQAQRALRHADLSAFSENEARFRAKLVSLGLLRVLSDDCCYVINRFKEGLQ